MNIRTGFSAADVRQLCASKKHLGSVFYIPLKINNLAITFRIRYDPRLKGFVAEPGQGIGDDWTGFTVRVHRSLITKIKKYMTKEYGVVATLNLLSKNT